MTMPESGSRAGVLVLSIAYPIAAHVAISRRSVVVTALAIAILAALWIIPSVVRGRIAAWIALPVIGYVCWRLAHAQGAAVALYLPPVLIQGFMAWVFGRTLVAGDVPLIARLVRVLHATDTEPVDPAVWPYARRLTMAWTALFVGLAAVNFILASIAMPDGLISLAGYDPPVSVPQHVWSLFANLLNYLIIGVFFAVEHAYRRHRFPKQPYRNLADFVRRSFAAGPELFGRHR
jgi:uncharacterized membrane protein